MKKYLITEAQIERVYNMGYAGADLAGLIETLKPIEPLSEVQIRDIYQQTTGFDMHIGHGSDIALLDFAREIERHITGETP